MKRLLLLIPLALTLLFSGCITKEPKCTTPMDCVGSPTEYGHWDCVEGGKCIWTEETPPIVFGFETGDFTGWTTETRADSGVTLSNPRVTITNTASEGQYAAYMTLHAVAFATQTLSMDFVLNETNCTLKYDRRVNLICDTTGVFKVPITTDKGETIAEIEKLTTPIDEVDYKTISFNFGEHPEFEQYTGKNLSLVFMLKRGQTLSCGVAGAKILAFIDNIRFEKC